MAWYDDPSFAMFFSREFRPMVKSVRKAAEVYVHNNAPEMEPILMTQAAFRAMLIARFLPHYKVLHKAALPEMMRHAAAQAFMVDEMDSTEAATLRYYLQQLRDTGELTFEDPKS